MTLNDQTFATITTDCNWGFDNFGAKKHGAARGHYAGSPAEVLSRIPVGRWSRKDSILFMWTSLTKIEEAVDVWRAWGFRQVTSWPWVKTVPSKAELAKGIGFWAHQPAELLVVLRKGKARGPRQDKSKKVEGLLCGPKDHPVFYSRRGAHSRKPLSLIEWIESRLPGPRLELWATGQRPGWTTWGHSTGYHLDHDGVHSFAEMKLTNYEYWLVTHPLMVRIAGMEPEDFEAWLGTQRARETDPADVARARALGLDPVPPVEGPVELIRPSVYRIRAA